VTEERIFTIAEARALLPRVKELTEAAASEIEEIRAAIEQAPDEDEERRLSLAAELHFRDWIQAMIDLGAEPKGAWLVDFDSGDGFYFCWQHGEDDIGHIHGYDTGFSGRRRIDW
jgi:hypothetical protein